MNKYLELKEKHSKEVNIFPMMFAFSQKQFDEGMEKLGLNKDDTKQIVSIGAGGFIKKTDSELLDKMFEEQSKERKVAIENDIDGTNFVKDMFKYELNNHEYCYTRGTQDTLNALGYTIEEIRADKKLLNGLNLAIQECKNEDND